jgi:hypothetical protein
MLRDDTRIEPGSPASAAIWRCASIGLGLVLALLLFLWQLTDRVPPRWDEGQYLVNAWAEWNAALQGGPSGLYHAFLTTDPRRPGLLALLAVPGFLLWQPSLNVAMLPFGLLWIVAASSIHDFTFNAGRLLFELDQRKSSIAAFFACVLFAVFPSVQADSHLFLVEFPLITAVALFNDCALRFWMTGGLGWAAATGTALAAGLLAKVTLPAFAVAAAGLTVWRFYLERGLIALCKAACVIAVPVILLAAPFYFHNFGQILEATRFLSSAAVASIYGLGGGMQLRPTLTFLISLLHQYEFLICTVLASAFAGRVLVSRKGRKLALLLIAASTLFPLFIVALSEFKIERYAYPGFVGLFVLGGLGLGAWCARQPRVAVGAAVVLLVLPIAKVGVTDGIISESLIARAAAVQAQLRLPGVGAARLCAASGSPRLAHRRARRRHSPQRRQTRTCRDCQQLACFPPGTVALHQPHDGAGPELRRLFISAVPPLGS